MLINTTIQKRPAPGAKIHLAVERKIYFYRVDAGLDSSKKPILFDPKPILRYIDQLDWANNERYLYDEGKYLCCWIDQISSPSRLRFGSVRRSELPQVEEYGKLNPLPIPASSGLAESVHVVFFSDNIVGAEFNFYGPRASKLPHYLSTKARDAAPNILHFDQLLRKDAAEQFREIRGIKVFQFKIKASYAESIKRANKGLSDALKAAREASHADEIEIILKPKAHSRDILSRRLIGAVQRMLPAKDLHQEASKLYVEGYGDDRESLIKLDLLNDSLIARRQVIKQDERSRALVSSAVYAAIEDAYYELKNELLEATTTWYD